MFSSICGTEDTTKEDDEPVKKKKKKKTKQAEEEEVLSEEPPTSPTVEVRQNCTAAWSFMQMDSFQNLLSNGGKISCINHGMRGLFHSDFIWFYPSL